MNYFDDFPDSTDGGTALIPRRVIIKGAMAVILATASPGGDAAETKLSRVRGAPTLDLGQFDLAKLGFEVKEYFLAGSARSYRLTGEAVENGEWNSAPAAAAPFKTRMVVVCPADKSRWNGSVLVEWLNVSGGFDYGPDWMYMHRELLHGGYAYVAVSAQRTGIEGGPALMPGRLPLKHADPARYGSLSHPGDAYAFDIFSQAGAAVRSRPEVFGRSPLRMIATGESQSAIFLTTYINAVDQKTPVYDGFLVHSRFGGAVPLDAPDVAAAGAGSAKVVRIRTDARVPVLLLITETDLLPLGGMPGFASARQADHERLRTWEIAGTSHGDNYWMVGDVDSGTAPIALLAARWRPSATMFGSSLKRPINAAPQHHYVACAALQRLDRWVAGKGAPPRAQPINLAEGTPQKLAVDAVGNATGGVRSPWLDAPLARLSGSGNEGGPAGALFGSTEAFDATTLERLYPGGKSEYLGRFERSLDSALKAGFLLEEYRTEILGLAAAGAQGSFS